MNDNSPGGLIEANSPELRAAVMAQMLTHIALTPSTVTFSAVFHGVLKASGLPEEECSVEIMAAALLLTEAGLVVSNTYRDSSLTIGGETTLTASP